MENENKLLEATIGYAKKGWKVVPLHWIVRPGICSCARNKDCSTPGKHPYGKDWPRNATCDEKFLTDFWTRHPKANVGIKLGKDSGILDIETDSDEQEKRLAEIFEGVFPVTPTAASARGKHRLFLYRGDLPLGAITLLDGIGFRIGNNDKGAMSVMPPSMHPTGVEYAWLVSPDDCDPAPLPDCVQRALWNLTAVGPSNGNGKPKEHWDAISKGVTSGNRNQSAAELAGFLFSKIGDVFDNSLIAVQWELFQGWNTRNQPPLPEPELRTTFESILKRERTKLANNTHEAEFSKHVKRDPESGRVTTEGWRLTIITNEPRSYMLFSPLWTGHLDLCAADMLSSDRIRHAALEQKDVWIPTNFRKVWHGDKKNPPLAAQLIESADYFDEGWNARRSYVIAERLYHALTSNAKHLSAGEELDYRGIPTAMEDGSYVFSFSDVYTYLARGEDRIKRKEISHLVKQLGGKAHTYRIAGVPTARMMIPLEGMQELQREIIRDDPTS